MAQNPKPAVEAGARVTLTVQVDVGNSWGNDCPVDQVFRQASAEAVYALKSLIQYGRDKAIGGARNMAIVGEPIVGVVVAERKR